MLRLNSLRAAARRATQTRAYVTVRSETTVQANESKPQEPHPSVSATNALPSHSYGSKDAAVSESVEQGIALKQQQAPNRVGVWSRSQNPRTTAMAGPRFEQTIVEDQPRPMAAIELIHKQPVRWTKDKVVSCDGGGGPLGHPRIFINTDKPKICWCTYCGVPYANEHHRKHLESLPSTTYPLAPPADAATVPGAHLQSSTGATEPLQSNTGAPYENR